jgi:hypothetical protein
VDLLGQAAPLGLLGLDDPHPQIRRELGVGRVGQQARVAALDEQPGALEVLLRKLELAQVLLVEPELGREALDLGAGRSHPHILGTGLGRAAGSVESCRSRGPRPYLGRSPGRAVAARAVELVAHGVPPTELVEVRLAVPLAHHPQGVRGVADGRLGVGVQTVEAALPLVRPGACGLHLPRSIGGAADRVPVGPGARPVGRASPAAPSLAGTILQTAWRWPPRRWVGRHRQLDLLKPRCPRRSTA